jgi:hypothetical protein
MPATTVWTEKHIYPWNRLKAGEDMPFAIAVQKDVFRYGLIPVYLTRDAALANGVSEECLLEMEYEGPAPDAGKEE